MKKLMTLILIAGFLTVQAQWTDDFESYSTGSWPTTWTADANATDNSTNYVDNTISFAGSKSLKLFGVLNGCWGALAYHPLAINAPFEVELSVRNGNESLTGCHPYGADIGLRQGTSWANPSRNFIIFKNDSIFSSSGMFLQTYTTLSWYTLKIRYEKPSSSTVKLSYWINGISKGSETLTAITEEDQLTNLELTVQEGTAWFDGLSVDNYAAPNLSVSPSNLTICWASGCDGNFNVSSNVSWTVTDNQSWLSVNPSSGSNNGTVTISASIDNPSTSARTATVTLSGTGVSDQIVTVTQDGQPSGIEDIDFINNLNIYPNPNTGEFTLEMELTRPEDFGLKIRNITGQVIYNEKLKGISGKHRQTIGISNFASGIYTVQLITDKGIVNKQVTIH